MSREAFEAAAKLPGPTPPSKQLTEFFPAEQKVTKEQKEPKDEKKDKKKHTEAKDRTGRWAGKMAPVTSF